MPTVIEPAVKGIDKTKLMPIVRERGISYLALFGSSARGEATPDSDIDLTVRFDHPVSLFDYVDVRLEMEAVLRRPVDLIPVDNAYSFVRDSMAADLVILHDSNSIGHIPVAPHRSV